MKSKKKDSFKKFIFYELSICLRIAFIIKKNLVEEYSLLFKKDIKNKTQNWGEHLIKE